MVKKVVRSFCSISFTGLKRLDGNSPRVNDLAELYDSRGMTQAKNETHANELFAQGVHCFFIDGNNNNT